MLTYIDCLSLSDLTEEEVDAIREHEHVPQMVAVEMGNYLVHTEDGVPAIKRMILDDIETAAAHGDAGHAIALRLVLKHFVDTHPENPNRADGVIP